MWPKSATRFGTKLPKCQKSATRCGKMSPKGFQGVSKGSKGFQGKVVPDVAKKRQRGSKGKCYQMWQKVAKGVPKVVQGRPTLFAKAYGLERLPAVLARRASAAGAP